MATWHRVLLLRQSKCFVFGYDLILLVIAKTSLWTTGLCCWHWWWSICSTMVIIYLWLLYYWWCYSLSFPHYNMLFAISNYQQIWCSLSSWSRVLWETYTGTVDKHRRDIGEWTWQGAICRFEIWWRWGPREQRWDLSNSSLNCINSVFPIEQATSSGVRANCIPYTYDKEESNKSDEHNKSDDDSSEGDPFEPPSNLNVPSGITLVGIKHVCLWLVKTNFCVYLKAEKQKVESSNRKDCLFRGRTRCSDGDSHQNEAIGQFQF